MVLFVIAPIMITIGGIMMLIAGGSEDRFSTGKKMATGAVVGILIALSAFLIVNIAVTALAKDKIQGMTLSGFTISCTATSPYVPPSTPDYSQTDPGYIAPTATPTRDNTQTDPGYIPPAN